MQFTGINNIYGYRVLSPGLMAPRLPRSQTASKEPSPVLQQNLLKLKFIETNYEIHSFIPIISIAPPLQDHYYSTQRHSRHSTDTVSEFCAKASQATCPRSQHGG